MLTENELEWLEQRDEVPSLYCRWCGFFWDEAECDGRSLHPFCPLINRKERILDALEFSEKVVAILAASHYKKSSCAEARLKAARLSVEEEMDADGK